MLDIHTGNETPRQPINLQTMSDILVDCARSSSMVVSLIGDRMSEMVFGSRAAQILLLLVCVLAAPLRAEVAPPDARCSAYVGQVINPMSIDLAAAQVAPLGRPRGEYETTEAHQKGMAALGSKLPETMVVMVPLDRERIKYDADRQGFEIEEYAIDNSNAPVEAALYAGDKPILPFTPMENIDIVGSSSEQVVGTYGATNAYGARVNVAQVQRVTKAIFERKAGNRETLFRSPQPVDAPPDFTTKPLGFFGVSPSIAPTLKSQLMAAVLIAPQAPYYVTGKKRWGARIDRPTEVSERVDLVIADIQCAVVTDAKHFVLWAAPTR